MPLTDQTNVSTVTILKADGASKKVGTPSPTVISVDSSANVTEAKGATLPTDGDAGYAKGCRFTKTDGSVGTTTYLNEGSASSADFNPVVTTAQAGVVGYAEVALTNAQVLALRATPITLVAAPGAGLVLQLLSAVLIFDYTGAYTETADNLAIKYTNGSGAAASQTIETTGFLDATSDQIRNAQPAIDVAMVSNAALVLHNTGDGEFGGGNAANVLRVKVAYRVHTTGL